MNCCTLLSYDAACRGVVQEKPLPDELLFDICVRVKREGGDAIFQCMKVSEQWKRVAQSAIFELTWTWATNPLQAALVTARFENLTSITMEGCRASTISWSAVFEAFGEHCPHLTSICMQQVHPLLDAIDINRLFTYCRGLLDLQLFHSLADGAELPTDCMPSLHHLHCSRAQVYHRFYPVQMQVVHALDSLTGLTTLSLQSVLLLSQLPPLHPLTNLHHLSLLGSENIEELPPLANLSLLESLDLEDCYRLRRLPPLDKLPRLHTLLLYRCMSLESISGIEHVTQLRVLDLGFCTSLDSIPALTALRFLEKLGFEGCSGRHPWIFRCLPQLTALKLLALPSCQEFYNSSILHLPCGLECLEMTTPFNNGNDLHLDGPTCLRSLTTYCGVTHPAEVTSTLQRLEIYTKDFPSLEALARLRELIFVEDNFTEGGRSCIHTCPALDVLVHLQRLHLQMPHLQNWHTHPFASLSCLQHLFLDTCGMLDHIPSFQGLSALKTLKIRCCMALHTLPFLDGSPQLKEVWLDTLISLQVLPELSKLTELKKLVIVQCPALAKVPSLEGLTLLEEVCIVNCGQIAKLPQLRGLRKLRALILTGCRRLRTLPAIDQLPSLQWLDLRGCRGLRPNTRESLHRWRVGQPVSAEVIWPDRFGQGEELSVASSKFFEFEEMFQERRSRWRSWKVDDPPQD